MIEYLQNDMHNNNVGSGGIECSGIDKLMY